VAHPALGDFVLSCDGDVPLLFTENETNHERLFPGQHNESAHVVSTFARDDQGRRPVYGGSEKFQTDPHWRDYILFYEYFHGDNGAGLGASHQTGWTGLVATLIELYGVVNPEGALEMGKKAAFERAPDARASKE
jgi:hypothetical protein